MMAMNMDDGTIRELDDGHTEGFKKLIEQLQPNEVGVFGHAAEIERLQSFVESRKKA